jgi:hypothetical protein
VAIVFAALTSLERNGQYVRIADVMAQARERMAEAGTHVA